MFYMDREAAVADFNRAAGGKTFQEGGSVAALVSCFGEELYEFNEALADYVLEQNDETRAQLCKEWGDVQVTLSNFAWFFDFNGQVAFNRVAESNMSKVGDSGMIERREDGKVLKGPNYKKPDMSGL